MSKPSSRLHAPRQDNNSRQADDQGKHGNCGDRIGGSDSGEVIHADEGDERKQGQCDLVDEDEARHPHADDETPAILECQEISDGRGLVVSVRNLQFRITEMARRCAANSLTGVKSPLRFGSALRQQWR